MKVVRRKTEIVGLFLLGIILGALGVAVSTGHSILSTGSFLEARGASGEDALATANQCTPKQANAEIFFISCGGIY